MTPRERSSLLKVLIAERHRTVAQSLEQVVMSTGWAEVAAIVHDAGSTIETGSKLDADVALVDLEMSPNGTLVAGLHALCPDTRIIVLADRAMRDADSLVTALAAGAVGAIYKESSLEDLVRALKHSSQTTPVVAEEATGLLLGSYIQALQEKRKRDLATIEALAAAVEVRDMTTGRHLDRVTTLAERCIERVDHNLAMNEEVSYGFTLHDIGKIGVPDAVLNKPGPLNREEWQVMRKHPELGVRIVEPIGFSSTTTDVILCHHERWDGAGYPNRLAKDEIPVTARVFAVADAFDAMTSDRPYRRAMPPAEAIGILKEESGKAYDPDVIDLFLEVAAA